MKAGYLFKHNIRALLRARGQRKHDLAQWCRRSDAWISKILGDANRNIPLKYLDRIADFFGLEAYQLFLPGLTPIAERRSGRDRRSGQDRRLGMAQPATAQSTVSAADLELLTEINGLTVADRRRFEEWIRRTRAVRDIATAPAHPADQTGPTDAPDARTPPVHRRTRG